MKLKNNLVILCILSFFLLACTPQVAPEDSTGRSGAQAQAPSTAVASDKEIAPAPAAETASIVPTCVDSDEGIKTKSLGYVGGVGVDGESYLKTDSCVSALAQREYYCDGPLSKFRVTVCSCTAGICLEPASVKSLGDYPELFFSNKPNVLIVVGDLAPTQHVQAAIVIATTLTAAFSEEVRTVLASEVSTKETKGLILIGDACENEYVASLLGEKTDCESDEQTGQGVLELKADGAGRHYLFITGGTTDDIRKAAKVLAEPDSYKLTGQKKIIGGKLSNPIII